MWAHRFLPLRLLKAVYWKIIFCRFGWQSYINHPLRIDGAHRIIIGNKCVVAYKSWLAAKAQTGEDPKLIIEDGCSIGNFNHIYATKSIILHKYVLTADKVYISDNLHGYEDINKPIKQQMIVQNGEVEIGEGSWLGENVCVLGAKIGRHCIIGANSVVTRDIPDYCVAVGAPAKVIKRYDKSSGQWQKVDIQKSDSASDLGW